MAFAFENYPGAILAITGTNGKTTTCELTGAILQSCGHADAVSGGNIGLPLSEIAADFLEKGSAAGSAAPIALEVSSFQLEYPGDFAPYAAVILNCASDHLDRHNNSMEEYKQVKYRIFDYVLPEFDFDRRRK
jgi:UDP-N-acetylmuramoylalanine--D-glutamate ligase